MAEVSHTELGRRLDAALTRVRELQARIDNYNVGLAGTERELEEAQVALREATAAVSAAVGSVMPSRG